jgi:hypothetical protein
LECAAFEPFALAIEHPANRLATGRTAVFCLSAAQL